VKEEEGGEGGAQEGGGGVGGGKGRLFLPKKRLRGNGWR